MRHHVLKMGLLLIKFVLIICATSVCARSKRPAVHQNASQSENDDLDNSLSECHYSEPRVSDCIRRVAERARHVLAAGAPALGVQPLEPLRVPSIRLRQRRAPSAFLYDAWLSDVTLHGLTDYEFNRLDVYPEELKVTTNVSLPRLSMFSEYVILGEFQMLPVESTGKMSVNFTNCTLALEALGARVHKRLVVRDASVRLRCPGAPRANLTEAHSTTGEMEMIAEHMGREHARELAGELQPALETALAMVLEDVANKVLKHLPADKLFPS